MTTSKSKNNKQKFLIPIGVVAALAVVYFVYEHFMYVTTENAEVQGQSLLISTKVTGYVMDVKVSEGQKVKKDDVLVEIDPRDYENLFRQIKGELGSLEARRRDAERNYSRLSTLVKSGAVSQQQFDTSSAGYSEVKAKYEALSAQVAQAQLNLENTKIKAPMDGVIARKSAEVGQLASAGTPLLGFVGTEKRWIMANFKETEISGIKVGAKVEIDVDAISGTSYKGVITAISSATGSTFTLLPPDNATGNFTKVVQRVPVKIDFTDLTPAQAELLRAGLSASVKVSKY